VPASPDVAAYAWLGRRDLRGTGGGSGRIKSPRGFGDVYARPYCNFVGKVNSPVNLRTSCWVKHFFPLSESGDLRGGGFGGARGSSCCCWSVVSSMFPVSASHTQRQVGRSVLYTGLLLVGTVTLHIHRGGSAGAPKRYGSCCWGRRSCSADAGGVLCALDAVCAHDRHLFDCGSSHDVRRISRAGTGIGPGFKLGASVMLAAAIWVITISLVPGDSGAGVRGWVDCSWWSRSRSSTIKMK